MHTVRRKKSIRASKTLIFKHTFNENYHTSSSDTKNGLFLEPSARPSVSLALQKDMGCEPKEKNPESSFSSDTTWKRFSH